MQLRRSTHSSAQIHRLSLQRSCRNVVTRWKVFFEDGSKLKQGNGYQAIDFNCGHRNYFCGEYKVKMQIFQGDQIVFCQVTKSEVQSVR